MPSIPSPDRCRAGSWQSRELAQGLCRGSHRDPTFSEHSLLVVLPLGSQRCLGPACLSVRPIRGSPCENSGPGYFEFGDETEGTSALSNLAKANSWRQNAGGDRG